MALQKKALVLIVIAVVVSITAVLLIVRVLAGLVPVHPWLTLRFICALALVAIITDCFLLLAVARGCLAVDNTRKRPLASRAYEWRRRLWNPLIGDLRLAFGANAVGLWGVILAVVLSGLLFAVTLMCWPGTLSIAETVGVGLGVVGLLFGILGYHVAFRVEKSIRSVITDGRQFVKEASQILQDEIIPKFNGETAEPADSSPDYADLICLLWIPYYGLTTDFDRVGKTFNSRLAQIQNLECYTCLITAEDPLSLMEDYAATYVESSIKYDKKAFSVIVDAIRGKPVEQWQTVLGDVSGLDIMDTKVGIVKNCILALQDLVSSTRRTRFWHPIPVPNKELTDGVVQLVWTQKKAAIVFLPPPPPRERRSPPSVPASTEPQSSATGTSTSDTKSKSPSEGTANKRTVTSFECSGFVTEDPYMISMIRALVKLRFKI